MNNYEKEAVEKKYNNHSRSADNVYFCVLMYNVNELVSTYPSGGVLQQTSGTRSSGYGRSGNKRTLSQLLLRSLITAAVLFCAIKPADSQRFLSYPNYEHWYISLNLGSSNFYGDISERRSAFSGGLFGNRDFMYGLSLTKKFNGVFGMRMHLLTGQLTDVNEELNMHFRSEILELSATGMLNLTNIFLGENIDRVVDVYAFVGGGMLRHRSWKRDVDTDTLIEAYGTGRRRNNAFVIPMGAGAEFRVTPTFTVTTEITLRNVQTDRLDAHINMSNAQEGYGLFMLGLNYQFEMPAELMRRNTRHTGKSSDPALRAYNRRKATVMKTRGYREGMRDRRQYERQKREWLIFRIFRRTRLDMATE